MKANNKNMITNNELRDDNGNNEDTLPPDDEEIIGCGNKISDVCAK